MNKTIIFATIIVMAGLVIGFYLYTENTRYSLLAPTEAVIYKIDRKTGQVWQMSYDQKRPMAVPVEQERLKRE